MTESRDARLENLVTLASELREKESLAELEAMLAEGEDPLELLECFIKGMRRVGEYFEEGRYFISGLIVAGEIVRLATEILEPHLAKLEIESHHDGTVLLGTIQGDIHDLGKNLFAILLKCHRFEVIDLGVDVPPERFLEKAREHEPDIIAMSCILTSSIPNLREAVALLQSDHTLEAAPVLIGGTCLDAQIAEQVGADQWGADAVDGLRICQQLMGAKA